MTAAALDRTGPSAAEPALAGDMVLAVEHLSAAFVYRTRTARAVRDAQKKGGPAGPPFPVVPPPADQEQPDVAPQLVQA